MIGHVLDAVARLLRNSSSPCRHRAVETGELMVITLLPLPHVRFQLVQPHAQTATMHLQIFLLLLCSFRRTLGLSHAVAGSLDLCSAIVSRISDFLLLLYPEHLEILLLRTP